MARGGGPSPRPALASRVDVRAHVSPKDRLPERIRYLCYRNFAGRLRTGGPQSCIECDRLPTRTSNTMERRDFLRTGFVAAGGVAVGATGVSQGADARCCRRTRRGDVVADRRRRTGRFVRASRRIGQTDVRSTARRPRAPMGDGHRPRRVRRVRQVQLTCAKSHFIPGDREFIRLFNMQESTDTAPYWFPSLLSLRQLPCTALPGGCDVRVRRHRPDR